MKATTSWSLVRQKVNHCLQYCGIFKNHQPWSNHPKFSPISQPIIVFLAIPKFGGWQFTPQPRSTQEICPAELEEPKKCHRRTRGASLWEYSWQELQTGTGDWGTGDWLLSQRWWKKWGVKQWHNFSQMKQRHFWPSFLVPFFFVSTAGSGNVPQATESFAPTRPARLLGASGCALWTPCCKWLITLYYAYYIILYYIILYYIIYTYVNIGLITPPTRVRLTLEGPFSSFPPENKTPLWNHKNFSIWLGNLWMSIKIFHRIPLDFDEILIAKNLMEFHWILMRSWGSAWMKLEMCPKMQGIRVGAINVIKWKMPKVFSWDRHISDQAKLIHKIIFNEAGHQQKKRSNEQHGVAVWEWQWWFF